VWIISNSRFGSQVLVIVYYHVVCKIQYLWDMCDSIKYSEVYECYMALSRNSCFGQLLLLQAELTAKFNCLASK